MTTYPDKYSSNKTNSTVNRGVEAKETEIANTQLDGGDKEWPRPAAAADGGGGSASSTTSTQLHDCPSYLQVVVEKHQHVSAAAASNASAPVATRCMMGCGCGCGGGGGAGDAAATTPLAAPPAGDTSNLHPFSSAYCLLGTRGSGGGGAADDRGGGGGVVQQYQARVRAEPAQCVEVYRFLRVSGAALAAGGSGARAAAWRRTARARRAARRAARELGAATRLAAGAPLAASVLTLRWALQMARDATAGAVHAASDYALKPALALLHNALLHPLLVFLGNLLQGVHEAVRPLCAALGECATHAATVLGALRLTGPAPAACCRCAVTALNK